MKLMEDILHQVQQGSLSVEEATERLATYENLGFAKVDHHRKRRQGFPETVFGEGKTTSQIIKIVQAIQKNKNDILITRVSKDKAHEVLQSMPNLTYDEQSQLIYSKRKGSQNGDGPFIAVLCAGTSDLRVAEEAAITAEVYGANVRRFYDVGVSGIHRLLDHIEDIQHATVSIVVAGMEGALPSVVGGLVSHPVIAVPTSVGYGANFNGLSALLTMLNSCASGISVVNIDNGYGGGYNATLIHQLAQKDT